MIQVIKPLNVVVLISGNGSNLQAIIDAIQFYALPIRISAVISNKPDVYGLERAKKAGIITQILPNSPLSKKVTPQNDYDELLTQCITSFSPDIVVLAGFMRILGDFVLNHFKNRILNIHPSLLPAYPGLKTHASALSDGVSEHGCSIHIVNEHLDGGPLLAQAKVRVKPTDDLSTLKDRVHKAEHFLYPTVLNWFAQRRIQITENGIFLDDALLPLPDLFSH